MTQSPGAEGKAVSHQIVCLRLTIKDAKPLGPNNLVGNKILKTQTEFCIRRLHKAIVASAVYIIAIYTCIEGLYMLFHRYW